MAFLRLFWPSFCSIFCWQVRSNSNYCLCLNRACRSLWHWTVPARIKSVCLGGNRNWSLYRSERVGCRMVCRFKSYHAWDATDAITGEYSSPVHPLLAVVSGHRESQQRTWLGASCLDFESSGLYSTRYSIIFCEVVAIYGVVRLIQSRSMQTCLARIDYWHRIFRESPTCPWRLPPYSQ